MRYLLDHPRAVGGGAMMLGGLAYALFESLSKGSGIGADPAPASSVPPGGWSGGPSGTVRPVVPPPLPGSVRTAAVVPPPLPGPAGRPDSGQQPKGLAVDDTVPAGVTVRPEVVRVIRLSISAACADGRFTPAEQAAILSQARAVGAESLIAADLQHPPGVRDVLAGLEDRVQRQQHYTIAFAIVRADEQVTDEERAYLRDVASALDLDDEAVAALEHEATTGITKAVEEGER